MKRATALFGPRNKCETNGEEGGKRRKRGTYRRMLQKFIKKNCKYIVYLYTKRAQSQNNRTISIPLNYFRLETGTYLFDRLISVNILSLAALSTTFYFSIYHASKRVIVSIVRHFVRKKRKTFSSRKKKKKKNRQRERERGTKRTMIKSYTRPIRSYFRTMIHRNSIEESASRPVEHGMENGRKWRVWGIELRK